MAQSTIEKKALKPKTKSLKVRVNRIKADMGKIREDQRCIRENQRNIEEKFGEVKRQCDQLREETQLIMKQSTCNRIQLILMFNILQARKDGDFDKAATLARFLKFTSEERSASYGVFLAASIDPIVAMHPRRRQSPYLVITSKNRSIICSSWDMKR